MTCREVLPGTYGHHHPDLLPGATNINTAKHRGTVVGRWPALKALGKKAKSLMITWSEWQDLNLRPCVPNGFLRWRTVELQGFFVLVDRRPCRSVHVHSVANLGPASASQFMRSAEVITQRWAHVVTGPLLKTRDSLEDSRRCQYGGRAREEVSLGHVAHRIGQLDVTARHCPVM